MKIRIRNPIQFQNDLEVPAVNAVSTRPSRRELGSTGQVISGNLFLTTDYNRDLQPPHMYDIFDRMRLSDGTISGMMNAIKLPILNVDWRVQPASDDEADIRIANWIQDKLFDMSTDWDSTLYQILLHLDYGSMPFEKVWDLNSENLIVLRKLAPRLPHSVLEWLVDNNGGYAGFKQATYKSFSFEEVELPAEKTVVFINRQEGSNFRGISFLRPAYKHWFMKDKMYIIDAIAKERRGIGVDVGTMKGPDADEEIQKQLEYALMGLHAHEKQFLVEQEESYTYRIEGLQGQPLPVLDSIEHHDKLILRSMLSEFIALGDAGGGSFALSRDKTSFFTMALNSIAKHICSVMNRHVIKPWIDYNWSVDKYPQLMYSRIDTRDMSMLSTAVKTLTDAGYLQPSAYDESVLRDALELPPVEKPEEFGIPLNGAQITSITTLMQRVGEGTISPESARGIIRASFPFLTNEQIDEITSNIPTPPENPIPTTEEERIFHPGHSPQSTHNPWGPRSSASMAREYREPISKLSSRQKNAVKNHTNNYSATNSALRSGGALPSTVKDIDSAIDAMPRTSRNMTVFKGVKDGSVTSKLEPGAVMTDNGYMSTTIRETGYPGTTKMNIKVPKGSKGIYTDEITAHPADQEFIMPRGSKVKVDSKTTKDGITTIEGTLIN